MKDQQIIHKLRQLKVIQPSKPMLRNIKQTVYQQIRSEDKIKSLFGFQEIFGNITTLAKSYRIAFYGISFALLLIVFLSLSSVFFPNQVHNVFLYSRLAIASNQYQKAQIALRDTTNRFSINNPSIHAGELSQSLSLANAELDRLKLKGEKGQYTAQECHQIYKKYLTYLESEEKNIPVTNPSFYQVKVQVNSYEEQAEKKLHMYNSL